MSLQVMFPLIPNNNPPPCLFLSPRSFIITYTKLWVWKIFINFVSENKHISILFVITSSTAPVLLLKEFTFSASIAAFLAFCNLCTVTDGKTSFSAFSSAEIFLLNDLLLSAVGLRSLSVLELFTLKTKFFYTF